MKRIPPPVYQTISGIATIQKDIQYSRPWESSINDSPRTIKTPNTFINSSIYNNVSPPLQYPSIPTKFRNGYDYSPNIFSNGMYYPYVNFNRNGVYEEPSSSMNDSGYCSPVLDMRVTNKELSNRRETVNII